MINKQKIRDYLLGKINADEADDFLADCFSTDEKAEEFEITRQNLIENYLNESLSDSDKISFKKHFLSNPHHRELLEFSDKLRNHLLKKKEIIVLKASENAKKSSTAFGWLVPSLALGGLLLAVFFGWRAITNSEMPNIARVDAPTPVSIQTETVAPEIKATPSQYPIMTPSPSPKPQQKKDEPPPVTENIKKNNAVFIFFLPIGAKGGNDEILKLPKNIKSVELGSPKPFLNFPKYRVKIYKFPSAPSKSVFEQEIDALRTNSKNQVFYTVPANIFSDGKYRFIVEGIRTDGSTEELPGTESFFQVEKGK